MHKRGRTGLCSCFLDRLCKVFLVASLAAIRTLFLLSSLGKYLLSTYSIPDHWCQGQSHEQARLTLTAPPHLSFFFPIFIVFIFYH